MRTCCLAVVVAEGALHVALGVALLYRLALVITLAAAGEADLDLRHAAFEVHAQWDDGEAALGHRAGPLLDLRAMHEQAARAGRLVVLVAAGVVGGEVRAIEPHLAVEGPGVGFANVGATVADGLDLGAGEANAGLEALHDLVVVERLAVRRDGLDLRHLAA